MKPYQNIWDFFRDTARLAGEGASLRDLYDALITVEGDDKWWRDASPEHVHALTEGWSQWPSFVPIRLRELFEGVEVDHNDDYVLAMVGHLGGRREQEVRLHLLRQDAELRDDVFWRMFEVEGGGQISLTNVDKFSARDLNWHNTVLRLADEGTISRARLLRSSLEALTRDFSAYRAGWFSTLYNSLEPGAIEAASDQDLLRLCVASSTTATTSLGAKYLAQVHREGLLEVPEFVEACAPGLSGQKGAAIALLKILTSLASAKDLPDDAVADAASSGLAHPHVDVQRSAVALLVALGREDIARASREALSPAVAAELLPEAAPTRPDVVSPHENAGRTIAAAEPVHPWTDDDARERFTALLEFGTSAMELELALAWLSITENAGTTLAPLVKRARRIEPEDDRFWIAALVLLAVRPDTSFLPRQFWQRVELVLHDGKQIEQAIGDPKRSRLEEEKTSLPSLVTRLREVVSIVRGLAPRRRLLATPTDSHGWVDAGVLLERLDSGCPPFPVDLTQAILRVRPADRDLVVAGVSAAPPVVTEAITIEWRLEGSVRRSPDGSPAWVSWEPSIAADEATEPSTTQPGLIPSATGRVRWERDRRCTSPLVAGALGLVTPDSLLPLVAAAVPVLQFALSEVDHAAGPILTAVASHPGRWTAETAQVVALGMASHFAELRTQSAELFADAIPVRLSASEAAVGFAACQPAVALSRWTSSFSDAATIAPLAVIDVLTNLLPRITRDTRGVGALLGVLLDESLRHSRAVTDPGIRDWLEAFTGSSGAARTARAALAFGGS